MQVAVVLLQVVFLSPGSCGAKVPVGMVPDLQALVGADGMAMEESDAASHAFA